MTIEEQVIYQYFTLSDQASQAMIARQQICALFAIDATVTAADGTVFTGMAEIKAFFESFFTHNRQLKHICQVTHTENGDQAAWVVAGQRQNGELFVLKGHDEYQFTGKLIQRLNVYAD